MVAPLTHRATITKQTRSLQAKGEQRAIPIAHIQDSIGDGWRSPEKRGRAGIMVREQLCPRISVEYEQESARTNCHYPRDSH